MCYAIGTPNVPAGKYRCDCNTGERKRAGEAHRYSARKHQAAFYAARGRTAVTVETNPYSASPAPYPVSKPKTTGGGWSGLNPNELKKSAAAKKRDVTENKSDDTPDTPPDPAKSTTDTADTTDPAPADPASADTAEADVETAPEPAVEPEVGSDSEPAAETGSEPAVEPASTPWKSGEVVSARDIFAARETLSGEEFADAVKSRTYDPASPLYLDPSRAGAETARTAVVTLLSDARPSQALLFNEDLAAQGKTPIYALAEDLDASQRAVVAHAARARSQELSRTLDTIPTGQPVKRMAASIDLGACVMTSSDMDFATACEDGTIDSRSVWDTSMAAADALDKTPAEILSAAGSDNAAKAAELMKDYKDGSLKLPNHIEIMNSGVDGAQLRDELVRSGVVDAADVEDIRQGSKRKLSKAPLTAKEKDNIATTYAVVASLAIRREMASNAGGHNSRAKSAPAARAMEETAKSAQPELARAHAHMVRGDMDKVAPRYSGSYRDVIDNRNKSGLTKKAWATLDEAASFLNEHEFVSAVDNVRSDYPDLSVNTISKMSRARFVHKGIPGTPLRNSATVFVDADKPDVALHETMHLIGYGSHTYRESGTQFLRERTRGLKQEYLGSGNGMGIPDDFSDPYVGRVYSSAAVNESKPIHSVEVQNADSEVLSVGAERMYSRVWEAKSLAAHRAVSDKAPVTALYDDPEHAALIRGVLTGARRAQVDIDL